jgi:hypothetical protein
MNKKQWKKLHGNFRCKILGINQLTRTPNNDINMHITDFVRLSYRRSLLWRQSLVDQEYLTEVRRLYPIFIFRCELCDTIDIRFGLITIDPTIRRYIGLTERCYYSQYACRHCDGWWEGDACRGGPECFRTCVCFG